MKLEVQRKAEVDILPRSLAIRTVREKPDAAPDGADFSPKTEGPLVQI